MSSEESSDASGSDSESEMNAGQGNDDFKDLMDEERAEFMSRMEETTKMVTQGAFGKAAWKPPTRKFQRTYRISLLQARVLHHQQSPGHDLRNGHHPTRRWILWFAYLDHIERIPGIMRLTIDVTYPEMVSQSVEALLNSRTKVFTIDILAFSLSTVQIQEYSKRALTDIWQDHARLGASPNRWLKSDFLQIKPDSQGPCARFITISNTEGLAVRYDVKYLEGKIVWPLNNFLTDTSNVMIVYDAQRAATAYNNIASKHQSNPLFPTTNAIDIRLYAAALVPEESITWVDLLERYLDSKRTKNLTPSDSQILLDNRDVLDDLRELSTMIQRKEILEFCSNNTHWHDVAVAIHHRFDNYVTGGATLNEYWRQLELAIRSMDERLDMGVTDIDQDEKVGTRDMLKEREGNAIAGIHSEWKQKSHLDERQHSCLYSMNQMDSFVPLTINNSEHPPTIIKSTWESRNKIDQLYDVWQNLHRDGGCINERINTTDNDPNDKQYEVGDDLFNAGWVRRQFMPKEDSDRLLLDTNRNIGNNKHLNRGTDLRPKIDPRNTFKPTASIHRVEWDYLINGRNRYREPQWDDKTKQVNNPNSSTETGFSISTHANPESSTQPKYITLAERQQQEQDTNVQGNTFKSLANDIRNTKPAIDQPSTSQALDRTSVMSPLSSTTSSSRKLTQKDILEHERYEEEQTRKQREYRHRQKLKTYNKKMQDLNNRALIQAAPQNTTVNIVHGSTTSGGNKPPNKDEPAPVSDEQEALRENDNIHKATKQSLMDAVEVAKRKYNELRTELTKTELDVKLLRQRIDAKLAEINKIRAKQVNANNRENTREATALIGINEKWRNKQMRSVISAGTPLQNRLLYEKAVDENNRQAEIAMAMITQYANEVATLTTEREDLQATLTIADIMVSSLKRQITEAETVRRERREELAILRDVEQIEQQEALEAAQQQQQSIQQSDSSQRQQFSSSDDLVPAIQLLPSSHQQPPPPQSSDVQQQQQTPTSGSQQTDVPSTADATSTQSATLTEPRLRRVEQQPWLIDPDAMDMTIPGRGPPSDSNEPMSTGQSSDSASAHDAEMNSLNTSLEQHRLSATLPAEPNYGSVLDNYPQAGFDPLARTEAPSPAESAVTLRQQQNLFRHSAESLAFQSATASPYGSSNLNASTGPTDNSQSLYNEMVQFVQVAAAALSSGNSQQPADDERQVLADSAANLMDRLQLQQDGNLGWPSQQTQVQPQHPANLSSGHLPHAPPVSNHTAMGLYLQRQQSVRTYNNNNK